MVRRRRPPVGTEPAARSGRDLPSPWARTTRRPCAWLTSIASLTYPKITRRQEQHGHVGYLPQRTGNDAMDRLGATLFGCAMLASALAGPLKQPQSNTRASNDESQPRHRSTARRRLALQRRQDLLDRPRRRLARDLHSASRNRCLGMAAHRQPRRPQLAEPDRRMYRPRAALRTANGTGHGHQVHLVLQRR